MSAWFPQAPRCGRDTCNSGEVIFCSPSFRDCPTTVTRKESVVAGSSFSAVPCVAFPIGKDSHGPFPECSCALASGDWSCGPASHQLVCSRKYRVLLDGSHPLERFASAQHSITLVASTTIAAGAGSLGGHSQSPRG